MSNERLRTQALQQISAYLDDALSPSEKQKLEARLARNPKLREQLEQLRRTKVILGHLPRLRAPRRYTLTPEMVKVRRSKPKPFMATLRLATALSAVLLVVLVGVQFLIGDSLLPIPLLEQAPLMESARLEQEATPQPLIQWGASGVGGGEESSPEGMGGGSEYMEAPEEGMEAAPPENIEEAPQPEMDMEDMPEELPEMPSPAQEAGQAPDVQDQDAEEKNMILGVNPDEGGEIIDRSEPAEQPAASPIEGLNLLDIAMIALAFIVFAGGLTLLLLRKRRTS